MNIYDIAKEAGTSIATVSRVINRKGNVSDQTREKIEAAIQKHAFISSRTKSSFVVSTKTIAVLVMDIRDPFWANTIHIMEREFYNYGYIALFCNTTHEKQKILQYISWLAQKKLDGLVLVGSSFKDKDIEDFLIANFQHIPIILSNAFLEIENGYSILVDDAKGLSICVDHLVEKGHRDIIFVENIESKSNVQKQEGFRASMTRYKLPVDQDNILQAAKSLNGGQSAIDILVGHKKKFTAIIFGHDIMAVGAIKRLKELGLSVPNDVAIIGYTNSIYSKISEPELTSLDVKLENTAEFSVKLLHDLLQGKKPTKSIIIRPELRIRKST